MTNLSTPEFPILDRKELRFYHVNIQDELFVALLDIVEHYLEDCGEGGYRRDLADEEPHVRSLIKFLNSLPEPTEARRVILARSYIQRARGFDGRLKPWPQAICPVCRLAIGMFDPDNPPRYFSCLNCGIDTVAEDTLRITGGMTTEQAYEILTPPERG